MGGGSTGRFAGTIGAIGRDDFSGGTLYAAATSETATDAANGSGKPAEVGGQFSESILERMRPWVFLPYGHPRKNREMDYLQKALKPYLDGYGTGFVAMDNIDALDPRAWAIKRFFKWVTRMQQNGNKKEEKNK